jgi:hypothetical protein
MVKAFGYQFVAADTVGVNLFFVHESAVGAGVLFTLDDAKRLATNGGDYPMLHAACSRHPWFFIPDNVDYADASFELDSMPLVLLSYKPGGQRNRQRAFFPTNITAALKAKLASRGSQHFAAVGTRVQDSGITTKPGKELVCAAQLEIKMVVAMMLSSFLCGGLLHRFGSDRLRMLLGRFSKL